MLPYILNTGLLRKVRLCVGLFDSQQMNDISDRKTVAENVLFARHVRSKQPNS
jgi:hypothetical protein